MKYSKASYKQIGISRKLLQDPYAHLNGDGVLEALAKVNSDQLLHPYAYIEDSDAYMPRNDQQPVPDGYVKDSYAASRISKQYSWIEEKVRDIHLDIWGKRHELWPEGVPVDPVALLDPDMASKCIGYDFHLAEFLGEVHNVGTEKEIAGVIDRIGKRISVSRRFDVSTRRFTAAHELGHALLHQEARMHRDRPINGVRQSREPRDTMEIEADKFAAYFLMPEKLVRARFKMVFGDVDVFVLTDDTGFALDPGNSMDLLNARKTLRDLSRVLASADYYNGRHMNSLSAQFGVSVETMAIRIEELGLVSI